MGAEELAAGLGEVLTARNAYAAETQWLQRDAKLLEEEKLILRDPAVASSQGIV